MRLTSATALLAATLMVFAVPAIAAGAPPAANAQADVELDAKGMANADATYAYFRAKILEKGTTLADKKVKCHGVSRAVFVATLDQALVACYPAIGATGKTRVPMDDAGAALSKCTRATTLKIIKTDAATVNACIATAF